MLQAAPRFKRAPQCWKRRFAAARRTILAGKGTVYCADNYVMPAAEVFLLGALRIPGMPANDDDGRQPVVELTPPGLADA